MEIGIEIVVLSFIVGLLFGVISVTAGIGGGVMYVPFMSLFMLLPMNVAVDTSAFIILISSGAAFLTYLKDKRTDMKSSLLFGCFSILDFG